MVAAAAVGVGIAATAGSAVMKANAAQSAAKKQNEGARTAIGEQARQFNTVRGDLMPYMDTGGAANTQLSYLMGLGGNAGGENNFLMGEDGKLSPDINQNLGGYGSLLKPFGMEDYQADPGYQFRLSEGQKALNRAYGAKGKYFSGEAIKGLEGYNQGMASQEYQNAYNRYTQNQQNMYDRLSGVTNRGFVASGTLGGFGAEKANQIGNISMSNANAQAAAKLAQGNAYATGLENIGSIAMNYMGGMGGGF